MTVEELLGRISSQELTEWMAYAQVEPFGAEIENWRFGMLAAVHVNLANPRAKAKPDDFVPRAKPPQSPDDHLKMIEAIFGKM